MTTVTNKDGIEFDIDAIATDLNNKVDLDGTNATYPHVVSRTPNSQGGVVEIWSDGYCVVTGMSGGTSEGNYFRIQLPVTFTTTDFIWNGQPRLSAFDTGDYYIRQIISTVMKNQIFYYVYLNGSITSNNPTIYFKAEGYIR